MEVTRMSLRRMASLTLVALVVLGSEVFGQGATKWVAVGSMHNWYSQYGCEIEHGNFPSQQYGLRWPAQYNWQDCQAAKGFWIGTTNWNDGTRVWPIKVVHVGPRVDGFSEGDFTAIDFTLNAKAERTKVFADGIPTFQVVEEVENIDPTMVADRMLYTKMNSSIGLTVERKVYAFSQQHHDNYHIFEFIFTNTGNTDADAEIEFPSQTLTDVYFYWQSRYSVVREIRYMVNNSAGWGINTMNDARGFPPDIANPLISAGENDIKAVFAWHGYHNQANRPPTPADFDNIGAPIWSPGLSAGYIDRADTNWRLGATHFVGMTPLYADQSPTNKINDPNQPSTTNYVASDEGITRNNSQFSSAKMQEEYTRMTQGHVPRHAWLVQSDGNFARQSVMANIGDGAPGGWSLAMGYGPYTIGPGQSVRIVYAEGVNGMTREEARRIGLKYKAGQITTAQKNDSVMLGRERLLNTFRRAKANFDANFNIPKPPNAPVSFEVNSGGNRISVSWDPSPNETQNNFAGYRVYRAESRPDSDYHMIYQCGGTAPADPAVAFSPSITYSFDDVTAIRGRDYFYYAVSFSTALPADPATQTPAGVLESSRFYSQTWDPANLKRPAGTSPDQVRIVPNPYVISGSAGVSRLSSDAPDRIAFFNIPGDCSIKIYTELGELIYEIDHRNGTGDDYWNSITSSTQVVVSGVYIVVITPRIDQLDEVTGEVQFRAGESIIKKLVIIR